jgi:hypothetical protein
MVRKCMDDDAAALMIMVSSTSEPKGAIGSSKSPNRSYIYGIKQNQNRLKMN